MPYPRVHVRAMLNQALGDLRVSIRRCVVQCNQPAAVRGIHIRPCVHGYDICMCEYGCILEYA